MRRGEKFEKQHFIFQYNNSIEKYAKKYNASQEKKKNDFFSLETVSWKARCDRVNVIEIFKIQVFKTNAWLML